VKQSMTLLITTEHFTSTSPTIFRTVYQRCAWTGFWNFWIKTPASSHRIRTEFFFAVAGAGLDFVFAEKMFLVVCFT